MNIYQQEETGTIYRGYDAPSDRYHKIGQDCEKCGAMNHGWETSSYCPTCRAEYQSRIVLDPETRPVGLPEIVETATYHGFMMQGGKRR